MILAVPRIIDYPDVLRSRTADGFRSLYHNSGAFGFARGLEAQIKTLAWIGPEDPTIRPAAQEFIRRVAAPYPATLARLSAKFWVEQLVGPLWVMPMSHWSFELDFGHGAWLPGLLSAIEIDPDLLKGRNTGDAIEFEPAERDACETLVAGLLANLKASDFAIAVPGCPLLCMLHHHQQLWWQTTDEMLYGALQSCTAH